MNKNTDVVLIPGFWLDASSWDDVVPVLRDAGLNPRPLTMPGVGASPHEAEGKGLSDWIDAVVAEIDAATGEIVVVGHSGGGNVAWGAVDARPDRVARVVFVDTVPPPPGANVGEFETSEPVIPFPGWDFFDDEEVGDLDEDTRVRTASQTRSIPTRVATDEIVLADARRYNVPVTVLSGHHDESEFRALLAKWGPFAHEFDAITDTEIVRLDTGHWPQFSQPQRLGEAIAGAVRRGGH
ncbi:alpha/beta fold hydrolase [Microbacterium sp.]|uniref:alpha/beta fold hydrolase n=1 Tax=Microbacterium sp. TaxID=51671 RepID=UPI003C73A37A